MMLGGAEEARRVLRLLFSVVALLSLACLAFVFLPAPYSDYAGLATVMGAGLLWTYLAFQLRIGRTEHAARSLDGELLRPRVIVEAAVLTGGDENRLLARRLSLLRLLALSIALGVVKLLWRVAT